MSKKYIKNFIDYEFFDFPKSKIKSFYYSHKFHYLKSQIENLSPCLIVCNKSCEFDEYLLRHTILTDYVVLKDSIVKKIYAKTLSKNKNKELIDAIADLKNALISVVIFPETQISVFGSSQKLPEQITEFMFETGLNLKFVNFINTYFAKPIWSDTFRHVPVSFNSKFNLSHQYLASLSKDERNSKINKCMPSSATIYGEKHKFEIRSNALAHGLERIIFTCPNCQSLFSLKPELNHLKCSNCLIPFECTPSGEIYTNGQMTTLDNIEQFLNQTIENQKFSDKEILVCEKICFDVMAYNVAMHHIPNLKLEVFKNKLKITGISFEKIIMFKDIEIVSFLPKNKLFLALKNEEVFEIYSKNFENFYFIYSLILSHNKKH